jgi:hypothetical protein
MNNKKNTKTERNIITTIALILILTLIPVFFSCSTKSDITNETAGATQITEASNIFDAREISIGDGIGGLIVKEVNIEPGSDPNNEDIYYAIVKFNGTLEISGKYISYSDQPLLGRSIIFYPDGNSQNMIPRLKHDNVEEIWFALENYDKAVELLSPPDSEGNATIIIENYTINYTLEVVHTAEIVKVIDKNIIKEPSLLQNSSDNTSIVAIETSEYVLQLSNSFDAREVKEGDTIIGMEIKTLEVYPNINVGNDDNYSAKVEFEGKVQISGNFKINKDDEFLDNLVSFIPDEESAAKLPKLSHDTRYIWFVFENTDKAKDSFKLQGNEGLATIIIDKYIINYAPSEVYNTAILIELIARG